MMGGIGLHTEHRDEHSKEIKQKHQIHVDATVKVSSHIPMAEPDGISWHILAPSRLNGLDGDFILP